MISLPESDVCPFTVVMNFASLEWVFKYVFFFLFLLIKCSVYDFIGCEIFLSVYVHMHFVLLIFQLRNFLPWMSLIANSCFPICLHLVVAYLLFIYLLCAGFVL